MSDFPPCPKCSSAYTYELNDMLMCPECGEEWSLTDTLNEVESESVIRDSAGNVLSDGDTVAVIKDLKVKGRPTAIKVGTKVRNIRLVRDNGDHDIDCKVDGFGAMYLKSSVVKRI